MKQVVFIIQCEKCLRYVVDGEVHSFLAPSSEEYESFKATGCQQGDCGRTDCADQMEKNKATTAIRDSRRRDGLAAWRRTHGSRGPKRQGTPPAASRATGGFTGVVRSSCPKDTEPLSGDQRPDVGDSQKPEDAMVPGLMSAVDRQEDFKASGAAESANARLIEFFDVPHNFGKWFARTLLKEIAHNDYINNRADDLREYYIPKGFYIDNYMIAEGLELPKTSHYRVCRIEDAVSLTKAQKFKLIHGYEMPQEGQKTF